MLIEERQMVETNKPSIDEEYEEVHVVWMKECSIDHNTSKLTRMSGLKNRYCSRSVMKYMKDVNQITSLVWCQFILEKLISSVRHYKESKELLRLYLLPLLPVSVLRSIFISKWLNLAIDPMGMNKGMELPRLHAQEHLDDFDYYMVVDMMEGKASGDY
ncbi:hypothetical protein Cgig2_021672 [Carnegiea gigantea]|uniref:Uncharacterized protein n=1 Tax=Carnegiea gigantea TaxID=171969 RepID=A0A9Q1KUN0_9CARY|nr:hypothetical protein Cgig2_021672 [Carnegiea gigantea]